MKRYVVYTEDQYGDEKNCGFYDTEEEAREGLREELEEGDCTEACIHNSFVAQILGRFAPKSIEYVEHLEEEKDV